MNPEKQKNAVAFIATIRQRQNGMADLLRQVSDMSLQQIQDFSDLLKNDEFAFLSRRECLKLRDGVDCIGAFSAQLVVAIRSLERMEKDFSACRVLYPLVLAKTEELRKALENADTEADNDGKEKP